MKRSFNIENAVFLMTLLILIIFAACASPYYTTSTDINFRVKRMEEYQRQSGDNFERISPVGMDISHVNRTLYIQSVLDDFYFFFVGNKVVMFLILAAFFSFNQRYRLIKRRNIFISQIKNKIYLVHYLQRKDGKKDALSFMYSF